MSKSTTPRNVRNKNPGNIEHRSYVWEGSRDNQTDPRFVQFVDAEHGFRAMARIYMSYARRALTTIEQIIYEWAPPYQKNPDGSYKLDGEGNRIVENDTEGYIDFVTEKLTMNRWDEITQDDYADLAYVMSLKEGGGYTIEQAYRGVPLAFIPNYTYQDEAA